MNTKINFNELAWNAPTHGDRIGYIPTDKYYKEIVEWLQTGTKVWTEKTKYSDGTPVIISRITFKDSQYDAVVDYIPSTEIINWTFRKISTYDI